MSLWEQCGQRVSWLRAAGFLEVIFLVVVFVPKKYSGSEQKANHTVINSKVCVRGFLARPQTNIYRQTICPGDERVLIDEDMLRLRKLRSLDTREVRAI